MFGAARERAVGLGYSAGWGALKTLPAGVSRRAFRAVADVATVRNGPGAQQLRRNLRRVVGPDVSDVRLDTLVGAGLRSYARYWLETFRLPSMDLTSVVDALTPHSVGYEYLEASLERGRGAILALPHSGNWEVSGIWLVAHSGPFTTVAERLRPESLFEQFVEYRQGLGMEVIALTGGERAPADVLAERLRENRVVCLMADRDLSHRGIEVDFFGERTRMPPGPALLAARTGAALHPVHAYFPDEHSWGHTVSPALELSGTRLRDQVIDGTQQMADFFAAHIAQRPADWHMLQKLWLADLPPRPDPAGSAPSPSTTVSQG